MLRQDGLKRRPGIRTPTSSETDLATFMLLS